MPGTTSSDNAIIKDVSRTLTASNDVTFGILKYNRSSSKPQMNLILDMTDSAAGITDGTGPRKINLHGMKFDTTSISVELKGGLWDFYDTTDLSSNVIAGGSSNNVVILSSGAVVTNMSGGGYNHFNSGGKFNAIRLLGGSVWHTRSSHWPFRGGSYNAFQVLEGSKLIVSGEMELGRVGSAVSALSHSRIEISGNGSNASVGNNTYIGNYASTVGSGGNSLYVTNNATATFKTIYAGYATRSNLVQLDSGASADATDLYVGYNAGASNNVVFVGGGASLNVSSIKVGLNGACGNTFFVSNGTVTCSSTSSSFALGTVSSTAAARGSNNLIRVMGANTTFAHAGGGPFGQGDYNTIEVDGTTLPWSSCSFEFSNTSGSLKFSNRGNTVRLKNGAVLTSGNFRLGNTAANQDRGEHVLDISGGSRLSANWIMVYSNDTVRIKIPRQGLDKPAVTVGNYLRFNTDSILDIDASEWKEGPSTCVLMRSQYGTTSGADAQVRVDQNTLDAVNARLGGRFIVALEGKELTIHRVRGITVSFR